MIPRKRRLDPSFSSSLQWPLWSLQFLPLLLLLLLLLLLGQMPGASATIRIVQTNETFVDRLAAFGPRLSSDGIYGILVPIAQFNKSNELGCDPLAQTPKIVNNQTWIALVLRGDCEFVQKVRNMQAAGAYGVIVGNNEDTGLITMSARGDTSDIEAYAVFVERDSYYELVEKGKAACDDCEYSTCVHMTPEPFHWPLLDIVIVTIICPTVIIFFAYSLWRVREYRARQKELAPTSMVINLPVKTFNKEAKKSNDPETCAICLDDFEDGDELRILPCKHEFHVKCIDPWLTTRKRYCPMCKTDACPGAASERTRLIIESTRLSADSPPTTTNTPAAAVATNAASAATARTEEEAETPPSSLSNSLHTLSRTGINSTEEDVLLHQDATQRPGESREGAHSHDDMDVDIESQLPATAAAATATADAERHGSSNDDVPTSIRIA